MSNVLVAFFSASGTTARLSERLAEAIGADLFEIVPEIPYTKKDLDWMDKKSRSSVEMNDRSCRPAISGKVENMDQYSVIFVGFPIWWYREPSIVDTFMESYDFTGKKIIPFATSGMSGIGDSAANMQALAPNAVVEEGRRFAAGTSAAQLREWAKGFI